MKKLIFLFVSIFSVSSLMGQDKFDFDYNISSAAFNSERKFYVHVHENYYKNKSDSLGVIFVLDCQSKAFFNNAKSIIDYLIWSYQIPPMIVVGIHSENRHKEFIPLDAGLNKDDEKNIGQAEKLREHLKEEIFPILENEFRANEFRALLGHSRAGAFIANTLFSESKDMFNAYLAISPGMHYVNRQILNDAQSMIQSNSEFHKFYYCTHGTVGSNEPFFEKQVNYLDSLFQTYPNKTIEWNKKEFAEKTHWSVVAPSIVEGLVKMSRAYQVDQFLIEKFSKNNELPLKGQIDDYYRTQLDKLKFTIPLKASDLRYYGNEMSEVENYSRAVELYDLSIDLASTEIKTYFAKAHALTMLNMKPEAIEVYNEVSKMLDINETQLDQKLVDRYKKNLKESIEDLNKKN